MGCHHLGIDYGVKAFAYCSSCGKSVKEIELESRLMSEKQERETAKEEFKRLYVRMANAEGQLKYVSAQCASMLEGLRKIDSIKRIKPSHAQTCGMETVMIHMTGSEYSELLDMFDSDAGQEFICKLHNTQIKLANAEQRRKDAEKWADDCGDASRQWEGIASERETIIGQLSEKIEQLEKTVIAARGYLDSEVF